MILECVECRTHVQCEVVGSYVRLSDGTGPSTLISLARCEECGSPLLVVQLNIGNMVEGDIWARPRLLFPSLNERVQTGLPSDVSRALDEAKDSFKAGAFTAAAIMCRKAVEGVCRSHGVNERTLAESIRAMRDSGVIDGLLFEWADALRLAGNKAAHETGHHVTRQDASDVLHFTDALLEYIYSYRSRFTEFRDRSARRDRPEL
ncbi:DUF4145 domain-containing protein [Methylosinus sp. RM1]|uniref:DUF4145 domain-containing protein n=1 Tax=Methylosinus sp. RM1 TaxID=2583817 RepID=UPI00140C7548|nr:DUF4145 domain-containing protein [Methylosinus sp. RM1]